MISLGGRPSWRGTPQARSTDELELEMRQLPGVEYVSFNCDTSPVVIEIGTDGSVDPDRVGRDVARLSRAYMDADVRVRVLDEADPAKESLVLEPSLRVQLRTIITVAGGDEECTELHLAHQGGWAVVGSGRTDGPEVAEATLAALRHLGFSIPFLVESVNELSADLGSGVLVILADPLGGQRRRGVADGRSLGEAVTRAVLDALNRYLQIVPSPTH